MTMTTIETTRSVRAHKRRPDIFNVTDAIAAKYGMEAAGAELCLPPLAVMTVSDRKTLWQHA